MKLKLKNWLLPWVAVSTLAFSQSALADLAMTITKEKDGTGNCSLDASTNDGKLCTNDQATYKVAYSVTPQPPTQTNVTLTLTIPAGEPFRFATSSGGLSVCKNVGPISADGRTLTCVMGSIATKAEDLPFDVVTTSGAKNGDILSKVSAELKSDQAVVPVVGNAVGVQVIAQPKVDIYKNLVGRDFGFRKPAGCTTAPDGALGVSLLFRVGLKIEELKGSEALADGWSYKDDVTQVHPRACFYDVQSFNQRGGGQLWPEASKNPLGIDAGKGTYAYDANTQTITAVSGTVTSGEVVGEFDGNKNVTAPHYIRIWIPNDVFLNTPTGTPQCTLSGKNTITGFDPNGISGASNYGSGFEPDYQGTDVGGNNQAVFGPIPLCSGDGAKVFASNTKGFSKSVTQTPPSMSNELVGPSDYIDGYVRWTNQAMRPSAQSMCDKWDNRKLQLDLLDPAVHKSDYPNSGAVGATNKFAYQTIPASGAMVADRTPAYTHIWADSAGLLKLAGSSGEVEYGYIPFSTTAGQSDIDLSSKSCNDGDSTLRAKSGNGGVPPSGWVTQSYLKANPSLVPYVNALRVVNIEVPIGRYLQLFTHYKVLNGNPEAANALWPNGTILPNYMSIQSDLADSKGNPFTPTTTGLSGSAWYQANTSFMGTSPTAVHLPSSCSKTTTELLADPSLYCDTSFSDRLRLVTETVGVRKGVLGADINGGPLQDTPTVPKRRGDIVTYQLWPSLTAQGAGLTIPNDLVLTDTLPGGVRYVPGSARYNGVSLPPSSVNVAETNGGLGTTVLKFLVPNVVATATGLSAPALVEFDAEIMLDDPLNSAGRTLTNKVVIDACEPGATIAANGTITCNSQTASQREAERTALRTVQLATTGALVVQKQVVGPLSQEIGSAFTMALRYLNAGSSAVEEHRLIDILPAVGEADRGFPDTQADKTSFSGTRPLLSVKTPAAAGYEVFYTMAPVASIDPSPKCPSNTGAGPGAWPQYAPGVPPINGCAGAAGATSWTLAAGDAAGVWTGIPPGATAILIKDRVSFKTTDAVRSVEMSFATPGSRDGDRYSNNVWAANGSPGTGPNQGQEGAGATFSTLSNNVTVRVVAASLVGTVFVDPNRNGATGFEPGTDTGLPGVTVTLTQNGIPVGTAKTASAVIPAGQFYDPATGGASPNPGPGLCPVPAAGLQVGQYLFCDLKAGSGYTVVETQPAGYQTTGNKAGTHGGTVVTATDTTSGITLGVGDHATGYDFGEVAGVNVSGRVYEEKNGNTTDDGNATDPGLVTTVTLACTGPGSAPAHNQTTQTAADGTYSFAGVPSGASCTITESQPTGYQNAYNTPGIGGTGQTGNTGTGNSTITLVVGTVDSTGNNFAENVPAAADMVPTIACTPSAPGVSTPVSCTVTCTNQGGSTAQNAFCSIPNAGDLPGSPVPTCSPNAAVPVGGTLSCTVNFVTPPAPWTINLLGGTGADNDTNGGTDPAAGNNKTSVPLVTTTTTTPTDPTPVPSLGWVAVGMLSMFMGLMGMRRRRTM